MGYCVHICRAKINVQKNSLGAISPLQKFRCWDPSLSPEQINLETIRDINIHMTKTQTNHPERRM